MAEKQSTYEHDSGVQSINRAFEILEALVDARHGMTIAELVDKLGLNKSTVHRILQTLVAWGYVTKDERLKCYKSGIKVMALASHYLNGLELKTEALPYLERLQQQTGVFVHLATLDQEEIIYLEKLGPYTHFRMYSHTGRRAPVYSTGLGKAIFAQLDERHRQSILDKLTFVSLTEHTVKSKEAFLAETDLTKQRGYALDEEENEEGMRCVAAPIFDYTGKVIGAVSVSGMTTAFTKEKIPLFGQYVRECADAISAQMGFMPNIA